MQNSINWPKEYIPGFTDNFCSNEVIVSNLTSVDVWKYINDTKYWEHYYSNVSNIRFHDKYEGSKLYKNARFSFKTFGYLIEAKITEYIEPQSGKPARLSWHGWTGEDGTNDRLNIIHAWLIEDLDNNRVRILTQESQIGEPAIKLAKTLPNPMINGHQEWLDGVIRSAQNKLEL